MWDKIFVLVYSDNSSEAYQLPSILIHSFLCCSCLVGAQLPDCIAYFIHFHYCRSRRAYILSCHPECCIFYCTKYIFCLNSWASAFFLNECYQYFFILCLNITCIHSLYTKTLWAYYLERINN